MNIRLPLYLKILLWFFVNLAVLAVAFVIFFAVQMRLGPDSLLSGRAGDRLEAVAELISYDLRETGMSGSREILERYSKVHGVNIYAFREDGVFLGEEEKEFPEALLAELEVKGNPRSGPRRPGRRPMRDMVTGGEGEEGVRPADTLFLIRTSSPTAYWAGVRATIRPPQALPPRSGILVIESRSLLGGGLFLDVKPLLATGGGGDGIVHVVLAAPGAGDDGGGEEADEGDGANCARGF